MDWRDAHDTASPGVTFRSPPNGPGPVNPRKKDSGPANPFGDLVELFARKHRILLKEHLNLIEQGFGVVRPRTFLHPVRLGRFGIGDGAVASQRCDELIQLQLFFGFDLSETDTHAQERIRGANRARSLNADAKRLEHKVYFRANGKRGVHFHIASMRADVGEGSPHAHVVAVGTKLHAARAAKPEVLAALFPCGTGRIGLRSSGRCSSSCRYVS